MKSQDIISILVTFTIGLIAGGYLFLTGFAPQFLAGNTATENIYSDFSINGYTYGGCLRAGACPSFQLKSDGTFGYLPQGASASIKPVTGKISASTMREIKKLFVSTTLKDASQKVQTSNCASYSDGLDYRYEVTIQGVVYNLDTCGTNLSSNAKLGITLSDLWQYFATIK